MKHKQSLLLVQVKKADIYTLYIKTFWCEDSLETKLFNQNPSPTSISSRSDYIFKVRHENIDVNNFYWLSRTYYSVRGNFHWKKKNNLSKLFLFL